MKQTLIYGSLRFNLIYRQEAVMGMCLHKIYEQLIGLYAFRVMLQTNLVQHKGHPHFVFFFSQCTPLRS